ncbi:SPOR domain-containing protein [Altererythrobacter indicus]|uniref:SPOR domain-containing protein n=2 Tax=Altericroceibacterium indicum TaxID=374177 RepID=A0A845A5U3_9SPHN|nr:SPOR domain-containing protein [Altericroceibacterium indicum]
MMNLGDPSRDAMAFGDDERLPWLEADEEEDAGAIDSTRLIGFVLAGFLLIVVIVGGLWWYFHASDDTTLVADGSTIEAPKGPYKTKPKDPGGMTFQGTGDTSFAVGEGQTREGRVAERPMDPAPQPVSGEGEKRTAIAADSSESVSGVGVQVGAYVTKETAQQGWVELVRRYPALHGVRHRIVEGQADIGHVFRLQAVAATHAEANTLCNTLKTQGAACQVKF